MTPDQNITDSDVELEPPDLEPAVVLVNPATGEALDYGATVDELAASMVAADELTGELRQFRQNIADELARRGDARNTRKLTLEDGTELELNAPTETNYRLDVLKSGLLELVEAGVIERSVVIGGVINRPKPAAPPEPRVDKREVNKLIKHPDERVAAAIKAAAVITNNGRTVKVKPAATR